MTRPSAAVLTALLFSLPVQAWGPHTEITRAAQAVVSDAPRLKKSLGDEWDRIARDYCWMGDWREAVRPDHYADDYLLFPGAPAHLSHMPPEVRKAYEPFFRRALQAIRTETPANAARWVGSLLHFVQDSGSPPHAANVGGASHAKMERWVDESKIDIVGYEPRLLGKTDDEALRGFLERMAGLDEYARVRGEKLRPLVERLTERENQPLELECALESARVTADVLHTLYTLGLAEPARAGASLRGRLDYRPPAGYATVPAKVVLAGTGFSTTTDAEGAFSFRNLPAGKYDVWLLATGYEAELVRGVELAAGREVVLDRKLRPDPVPGNLVRNPALAVNWVRDAEPDGWCRDPTKPGRWAAALVRVPVDRRCMVRVDFRPGKAVPVAVRWRTDPSKAEGREVALTEKAEVAPDPLAKPFEKGFLFLELLIETDRPLANVCRHVSVVFGGR